MRSIRVAAPPATSCSLHFRAHSQRSLHYPPLSPHPFLSFSLTLFVYARPPAWMKTIPVWMRWQFPAVLTRCSSNILTGSIRRKRDFAFDMRTLYLGNTREEVLRTLGRLFERIDKLRLNIRERGLVFEISRRINAIGRYFRLHYARLWSRAEYTIKWNINYTRGKINIGSFVNLLRLKFGNTYIRDRSIISLQYSNHSSDFENSGYEREIKTLAIRVLRVTSAREK